MASHPPDGKRNGAKHRLLVVDDDDDIRRILQHLLQNSGYEVFVAQDGKAAMEMVLAHRPDLVLLDIMMPETHGFSVCHDIKSNDSLKGTKVIVISCKSFPADRRQAQAVGVDKFLAKPLNHDELLDSIKTLLNS